MASVADVLHGRGVFMRAIFAGTPDFAVPTLRAMLKAGHEVALVITQPDRPAGRGRKLGPTPVKTCAIENAVPVLQPKSINAPESVAVIRHLEPDVLVTEAFGQKLLAEVLSVPKLGGFNVHASLLPRYRGAAPINWAILNGEDRTGVSIIRMGREIDAGEILEQESLPIEPDWTAGDLAGALSGIGARLMVRVLSEVEFNAANAVEQDGSLASFAPKLTKADGLIPWRKTARAVHNHIRGMTPWPGAFTFCADGRTGKRLRLAVLKSAVAEETGQSAEPGAVISVTDEGLVTACGEGSVLVTELRPAGRRGMSAAEFARGHMSDVPMRFTSDE